VALTRKPVWLFGDLCLENVQISQQKGSRALGRICVCQEKYWVVIWPKISTRIAFQREGSAELYIRPKICIGRIRFIKFDQSPKLNGKIYGKFLN